MKDFKERCAERLDVPADAVGTVKVSVVGHGRALIENHRGLLEYGRERIEISGGSVRLRIEGDELYLAAMDTEAMLITGLITSVEFE